MTMPWSFRVLITIALGWCCASSASALQKQPSNPVADLVDFSEGLPFEYRADIQLNVVESPKAASLTKAVRKKLLERLFDDAQRARFPYQKRDVTGDQLTNSQRLDGAMASLKLDSLSVRTRVIAAMLPMDRIRARQLFDEIHLDIASSPCTSPMVADVSAYYQTLEKLFASFSGPERAQGDDRRFLEQHLFPLLSPMQLAQAAALIGKLHLSEEEMTKISSLYSAALVNARATDRELGYLLKQDQLNTTIEQLIANNREGSAEQFGLLNSYRTFLAASASEPACSDITASRNAIASMFNALLAKHPNQEIKFFSPEDLKPRSVGDSARLEVIPSASEISHGLTRRLVAFRAAEQHDAQVNPLAFQDWDSDTTELLQRADVFDISRGDCRICLFQEKAELLFVLFDLSPPDSVRETVLDHLVTFMADSEIQKDRPLEWIYRFKLLLNLSRKASPDQKRQIEELKKRIPRKVLIFLPSSMQSRIVSDIARQRNIIMSTYAMGEKVLQSPFVMPPY